MPNFKIVLQAGFILLLLLPSFLLTSQSTTAKEIQREPISENFEKAMSVQKPSDAQIDSILALIDAYCSINGDSCLLLAQRVLDLTKNHRNKRLYAGALIEGANAYSNQGDNDKSVQLAMEAKTIAESIGDEAKVGHANNLLGAIAMGRGDYEEALTYFISVANTYERLGDKYAVAKTYSNISAIFFDMNELTKSGEYITRLNKIAVDLDDNNLRVKVASKQALNWMTEGIHYYLENQQDTADSQRHLDTLNVYFNKSEAEYYRGLGIAKKIKDKEMEVVILNNLVPLTLNMGNYDKALIVAKEAETNAEVLGSIELLIQSKFNLSSVYRYLGEQNNAATYGEESLILAKKHGLDRKEFLANRTLYDLYKKMGNYEKANLHLEELRVYDNKIGDAERNKALAEVEAEYQTVKKENRILELETAKTKVEKQRNYFVGGGFLIALLSFFGFRLNKVRKERNDKMAFAEALIFAQEEERKRIARDLHDGVGQSLLLIKKQMESTHGTTLENKQMIASTLEEVRTISQNLHPFQLEKFGLTTTIKDIINKVDQSTALFITSEIEDIDNQLSAKAEINIYRTIQEALSNMVKHAEATAGKVSIQSTPKEIIIKIQDNGKGFDHELAIVRSKSLGLRTMYERVSNMGGSLKFQRGNPAGSTLEIRIPKTK